MINGLAAAVFLGMAIVFLGVAVETGMGLAWVFAVLNGLLSLLNLMVYMAKGKGEGRNL
jgi:hypothetical protein